MAPLRRPNPGIVDRVPLPALLTVLGAIGGVLTSEALSDGDSSIDLLLLLSTAMVCAALGRTLLQTHRSRWWPLVAGLCIVIAGALNGCIIGVAVGGGSGLVFGAMFGGYCSLAFLVPVMLVMSSTRSLGKARARSMVDRVVRRAPWRMLFTVAAVAAAMVADAHVRHAHRAQTLLFFATLATVGILLADIRAYVAFRSLMCRMGSMHSIAASDFLGTPAIDLGVGEHLFADERLHDAGGPFRASEAPGFVVRGHARLAQHALQRALMVDVLSVVVTVAATAFRLRYFLC